MSAPALRAQGRVYAYFDDVADARAMTIQPSNGRIVVVGETVRDERFYDFAAARCRR